jgi:hypothetical protein
MADIRTMLDCLWQDYATLNPRAKAVHDLLTARGERVSNDHIAFRTFDLPETHLWVLAEHFTRLGYRHGGAYDIADKHAVAIHLNPPEPGLPKVFISHLLTSHFSAAFQETVRSLVAQMPTGATGRPDFLWSGMPWQPVPYATYLALKQESEYAAWVAAFGYRANHFTVAVHDLAFTQDIYELNAFLKQNGFTLADSGGEVKGLPSDLLEQSSTLAETVAVRFADGEHAIPACYYEFAKRYPRADGSLFPGFVETSAAKLFDSTTVR